MSWKGFFVSVIAVLLSLGSTGSVMADAGGTAVVRVVTSPAYSDATLRFSGVPAGEVRLDGSGAATLSAQVAGGQHVSTLAPLPPALVNAGYLLSDISCDDSGSAQPGSADLQSGTATFGIEDGEIATCTFTLRPALACKCPEAGRWQIVNHAGVMACTGMVTMSLPLEADRSTGTFETNRACDTMTGRGMSPDEGEVTMRLQPGCNWKGEVTVRQEGSPAVIHFHWDVVENPSRITGRLDSTFSQQGTSCKTARTFEMDFKS